LKLEILKSIVCHEPVCEELVEIINNNKLNVVLDIDSTLIKAEETTKSAR